MPPRRWLPCRDRRTRTPAPAGRPTPNDTNVAIPDLGDLVVDLVAPNGATARLKDSDGWDGANDVVQSWTVEASSVQAAGTWKLRVRDVYGGDTGTIRRWSLTS